MSETTTTTKAETNLVRLNKLLAERGLASRRGADKLIAEGLVTVNGKKVYELGIKVSEHQDKIVVDGKPLRAKNQMFYIMFNKPKAVITSMTDPLDRPTVADYVAEVPGRVFPIGRLDWDSEGLLIMTNDGDFANEVMHPAKEVTKTYHVKVNGQPAPDKIAKLLSGVSIPDGRVRAKHIEKLKMSKSKTTKTSDKYDWFKIVITEGKNHQVREMFKKIGFDVMKLQRVAIGKLRLGALETGEYQYINDAARDRIFMPDLPTEVHARRDVRNPSKKRTDAAGNRKTFQKKLNTLK